MGQQRLRIFISSPGDVAEERVLANNLVRRLFDEYADRLWIEPIFWEHEPLLATSTFQNQIPPPHDCEVAACILWSRLGTRLPANITRADGSRYASGTEYEFEDAAQSFRASGHSELLVYRETADPVVSLKDTKVLLERVAQKEALDGFIQKWFVNTDGTLKAAFHSFATTADFEQLLEEHLRNLIDRRLPSGTTDAMPAKPSWTGGSPFRGLDVFEFQHAPVFFGRTQAIGDLLNALRTNAASGRGFVLVVGVSGGGKSSLVRAGVLPVLVQPGVIEGVSFWRRTVLKLSDGGGNLLRALASALLGPTALPELGSDGTTAEQVAELLRQNPAVAFPLNKGGLSQAAAAMAREQNLPQQSEARLVIVVDQLEERFTLPNVTVSSVLFSPDGRFAVSGSADGTVKLWPLTAGKDIRRLQGHSAGVSSVVFSPDGRTALSGSDDKTLTLWDVATGKQIRTFQGHTKGVGSVAFSPDGHTALSGSSEDTLRLWDLSTGKQILTLPGHVNGVRHVAISPDGRTALSSGLYEKTIKVWDLVTGKEIRPLLGHSDQVLCIAFSPDGRTAISGSGDKTLKVWDLTSGKNIRTFSGHSDNLLCVSLSPDGRSVLSGGVDHTLKLWDLTTGTEIRTLQGHTATVDSVAFSPDGRSVLPGSWDKTVMLWDFSRAARYFEFEATVPNAQAKLQKKPNDAASLGALGEWYAFRGVNDWAVELLEKARAGGIAVDPLTIAQCYWELAEELTPQSKLTRKDCLTAAAKEYQLASSQAKTQSDRFYLGLCLAAVETATTQPATAPATGPVDPSTP